MKNVFRQVRPWQYLLLGIFVGSLVFFGGLTVYREYRIHSLNDWSVVQTWNSEGGYAQVSAYLSKDLGVTQENILFKQHDIDAYLEELGQIAPSEDARLWISAYHGIGSLTVASKEANVSVTAYGTGGDYFYFHPAQMLSGRTYTEEDLMQDYIVIDEVVAWQLFGSPDVVGMTVEIGGLPYVVIGVIQKESGKYYEMAGNQVPTVYVPFETLKRHAQDSVITGMEAILPNPIEDYALDILEKELGYAQEDCTYVENSARYDYFSLWDILKEGSQRVMYQKAIVYPYWENVARAWENVLLSVMILQLISILAPMIIAVWFLVYLWKHRRWHREDLSNLWDRIKQSVYRKLDAYRLDKKKTMSHEEEKDEEQ